MTKLEAAERQIVAGIEMLARGDDPLAIHVVAASVLNMLRELIKQGGDNYAAQVLRQGVFYAATAELKGTPAKLPTNAAMDALIEKVAAGLEAGEIKEPADLDVNLDDKALHKLLDYIVKPYNFLKHADRDPLETLDEDDVDPKGAIIHALTAYGMLCPGRPLPDKIKPFLAANNLL